MFGRNLPGSVRKLTEKGHICEGYNNDCQNEATVCMQGETDSFGAEYSMLCDDCLKLTKAAQAESDADDFCEWCGNKTTVQFARDATESCGRVYRLCRPCITQNIKDSI